MSFDGLESASDAGWGQYGMARLVNGTFAQQHAKDGFLSETNVPAGTPDTDRNDRRQAEPPPDSGLLLAR
ncbi:hypothetical protein [Streptomyces sp. RKAG293]|uniref:hypothetical protein n=1 Tax=Streptomyces sp. RKAG293 TaxID=2893403 RepID=UPI0020333FFC|nr:hypothetical protein [Streptomyces sp. RKAG293]MCM2423241.1 hypothetical protein [Streptomyces sp. RKAG293]